MGRDILLVLNLLSTLLHHTLLCVELIRSSKYKITDIDRLVLHMESDSNTTAETCAMSAIVLAGAQEVGSLHTWLVHFRSGLP